MIGRTLSHYRILDKLGSGGMGDVYLAEDTKLDRKVALKVLPPETVSEKRRERFKREAKAIAALDHPNIVQVFSVEEAEGIHFITMQLVQGKTLTHLIPKNGFPLSQFFDIAIPLADAVAAAHQEGITHRDLKPDNVMVTDDGRVKVLDFGLAKPTGGFARTDEASDVPTVAKTDEGVIVGTVSYMSPEQAEGKPADARSDVFSLGIVFYEMMTGRRPFEGDTPTAVLSSIIKDVPPAVSEIRSGISRELSRMVRRCLAKDRSRRLQNALDVRNELEECKSEMDSGVNIAAPTRQGFRWLPMLGGVALLVLVTLSGYSLLRPNDVRKRLVRPRQLTSAIGVEQYATWSPDGGRLAYMSDQSGNSDVWVIQVGGGPPVNLTTNHPGFDGLPSWSPKGDQIAFLSDREDGGYFVVSALGGTPRRLLEILGPQTGSPPQWSPDAARLACVLYEDGAAVAEIVSLDSGAATRVPLPGREGYSRLDLAWSTDERFFAYVDARNYTAQVTQIRVVRLEDGESYAVTDGMTNALSPRWSLDGRTLYFVSNRDGSMDLWAQPMSGDGAPRGDPRPLTTGLAIRSATLSPDGTTLAYSRGREIRNIFRVPILSDRLATW
ncbi:MAG TPA: protein kinase, partial [Vicinamibacteria bacterium]|nr:protein kinase [Vicinamibacteria bacterium]